MELLALGKPIKKPPRSDERDGELFCGTLTFETLSTNPQAAFTLNKDYKYVIIYASKYGNYIDDVILLFTKNRVCTFVFFNNSFANLCKEGTLNTKKSAVTCGTSEKTS